MSDDERTPHPKNAPGPFYVVNGCCMTCLAPHAQAPNLMGFDDSEGHCFVKQQPQSEEETYLAIRAVRSSEVRCLRYRGHDPDILRRLGEIGEADACDFPRSTSPILRNHVTFTATFVNDVSDVATALRDYILGQNHEPARFQVTPSKRKDGVVSFAYSWYEENYYTLNVAQADPAHDRWLVHHSPVWKAGSVAVSLMIDDWLHSDSRFSDVRWYAARQTDDWQDRPY